MRRGGKAKADLHAFITLHANVDIIPLNYLFRDVSSQLRQMNILYGGCVCECVRACACTWIFRRFGKENKLKIFYLFILFKAQKF